MGPPLDPSLDPALCAKEADDHYKKALEIAEILHPCNPILLAISMNYSVFLYEVKRELVMASKLAEKAVLKANDNKDSFEDEESAKEVNIIIELISENIEKWGVDADI